MNSTTEDMNESTAAEGDKPSYSELLKMVNEVAKPLAGKKLTKALYKTIKKGELCSIYLTLHPSALPSATIIINYL